MFRQNHIESPDVLSDIQRNAFLFPFILLPDRIKCTQRRDIDSLYLGNLQYAYRNIRMS